MNVSSTAPVREGSALATSQGLDGNSFMTLLVSQLKQQDPLSPQDPTQWVGQLVQFNSLEQLIQINQKIGSPSS